MDGFRVVLLGLVGFTAVGMVSREISTITVSRRKPEVWKSSTEHTNSNYGFWNSTVNPPSKPETVLRPRHNYKFNGEP